MAIDWARCCTERVKKSVLPFKLNEDHVRTDRELGRVRSILELYCPLLYQCFAHYSIGPDAGSGSGCHRATWDQAAFTSFCSECKIDLGEEKGSRATDRLVIS